MIRFALAAILLAGSTAAIAQSKWLAPLPSEVPAPVSRRAEVAAASGRERRQLTNMIRDGERAGQLTRSEAKDLRREVRATGSVATRLGAGGYSAPERREFEARWHLVRDRIVTTRTRGISGR